MLKLISLSLAKIQWFNWFSVSFFFFFLFANGISVNWNVDFGRLVFYSLCSAKFTYSRSSCAGQTQSRIVLPRYKIECNYGFLWLLQLLLLHSINKIAWSFVCHLVSPLSIFFLSLAQITSWKVLKHCMRFIRIEQTKSEPFQLHTYLIAAVKAYNGRNYEVDEEKNAK